MAHSIRPSRKFKEIQRENLNNSAASCFHGRPASIQRTSWTSRILPTNSRLQRRAHAGSGRCEHLCGLLFSNRNEGIDNPAVELSPA